jgi:hypothetical protein
MIYTPTVVLLAISVLLPRISRQLSSNAKTDAYDSKQHNIRKVPTQAQDVIRQRVSEQ